MSKTHVVMLLDESGSMSPHKHAVVTTFNSYTKELKNGTKRCFLSLYKFDQRPGVEVLRKVFTNRKVNECYPLTAQQYMPYGGTPLYDAVGALIQKTKKRLPKDAKVLFVIHTDGQENASHKYNQERVKTLVKRMEDKRGWTFVYLGEGAAAWNAGYDFGIDNVANFSSTLRGAAMDKLGVATCNYVADASVGGAMGSTKTLYANANLDADDVDPQETLKNTSSVIATDNADADNG